jgi:hypothetical protein
MEKILFFGRSDGGEDIFGRISEANNIVMDFSYM